MRLVATVMVRDEVDIVAAMIEHHVAQGVDLIIATDNASVDGTTEVLQAYADAGVVELHHDPEHRKQQHAVVTAMARRAFVEHGADWVINADADEFWLPVDHRLTLREAMSDIPLELNAFTADVTNLVGHPAQRGAGVNRLAWRDRRPVAELNRAGVYAHPTANAVHRGSADVVVAQGNHFVSLPSAGQPPAALKIETLHLPWRSWDQTERKVVNAGRAYANNPDLRPSKNHHGMKDYRRYLAGQLWYHYLLRLPTVDELVTAGGADWFLEDRRLERLLESLRSSGAIRPDLLDSCLDSTRDDVIDDGVHREAARVARMLIDLERERDEARATAEAEAERATRLEKKLSRARAAADAPVTMRLRRSARRAVRAARRRLPPVGG